MHAFTKAAHDADRGERGMLANPHSVEAYRGS